MIPYIKFYIPDGHLEKPTLDLFRRAGFEVSISERGYNPRIDDKEIELKRLRPQDFPFALALGKGSLGITGTDILEEFRLTYLDKAGNVEVVLPLGFGKTRLVSAVSELALPGVKNMDDFKDYADKRKKKGEDVIIATEYPKIAEKYLGENKIRNHIIRKPAGKTEAWIVPPDPEADMIIDTTETGTTLRENRCRELDTVREASSVLVASKKSLDDAEKKRKIDEIVQLFSGALEGEGKVNVYMDVVDPEDLDDVLGIIREYVKKPTVSELQDGGYDVFIVIDEKNLKYILPELIRKGASKIAVSDTRMIIG